MRVIDIDNYTEVMAMQKEAVLSIDQAINDYISEANKMLGANYFGSALHPRLVTITNSMKVVLAQKLTELNMQEMKTIKEFTDGTVEKDRLSY